jgi:uncharacterized protein YciW
MAETRPNGFSEVAVSSTSSSEHNQPVVVRSIPSALTELEGLLAAFVVSTILGSAHSESSEILHRLGELGTPPWLRDNIERSAGRWTVSDEDRIDVIVGYAAKVTSAPGNILNHDIERLRAVGLGDLDIVDLNNIVAYWRHSDPAVE